MLLLTIIGLLSLVISMWVITRDLISPSVIYCGVWLLTLLAVLASGDLFYPISPYVCLIFLVGASAFCAGGVTYQVILGRGAIVSAPSEDADLRRYRRFALDVLLVIIALTLPLYWRAVLSTFGDAASTGSVALGVLLNSIRRASVEAGDQGVTIGPLANVVVVSQFVAAAMFYERDGSRGRAWRAAAAILLALVLGAMSGTKGTAVRLILTLFFLAWLMNGRLRAAWIIWTLLLTTTLFAAGILFVNFAGNAGDDSSAMANVLAETVLNYWIGSSIALGPVADNPDIMESSQHIGRFFLETARSFGFNVYVPSLHAQYTLISDTTDTPDTNTYTIYFSYFKDFGWLGMILAMSVLAFASTALYSCARQGSSIAKQLYAMTCVGLVLSFAAEHFMLELNPYIKAVLFFGFIYSFIPSLERMQLRLRESHA